MSVFNQLPSEAVALLTHVDPDALPPAAYASGWIDLGKFEAILAVVMAGALGTSATIDAKLEQAIDELGTEAKDIPNKAVAQMSQSSTQALINCRGSELDMNGGYRFVRLFMNIGGASSDAGALVLGLGPRHSPASLHNAATVMEIVT